MSIPHWSGKELEEAVEPVLTRLVKQYKLESEKLTEKQLVEAIRQALPDFEKHVAVGPNATYGQSVVYLPGREANRLASLYHELLYAVESAFPGETRHETALRYIREAEISTEDPDQPSSDTAQSES